MSYQIIYQKEFSRIFNIFALSPVFVFYMHFVYGAWIDEADAIGYNKHRLPNEQHTNGFQR